MNKIIKGIARSVLGDYAPYYILQCASARGADDGASCRPYRVTPITQDEIESYPDQMVRDQSSYGGADSHAYACYDGDRIVGICFYWYGGRYASRNFWPLKPGEAKLVQIVTSPDMRGKKVAGTLIARSWEHMLQRGFVRSYARVWHSNEPSLRAFAGAEWKRHALVLEINPLRRKKPFRVRLPA
jgi:GNAT superfamily N-acetyltransferase